MLKPLFARVLLKRETLKKVGSIIIPESSQDRHARCCGTILALGPSASDQLNIGDRVVFGKYAGSWLDEDGRDNNEGEFYIVQDEDILAVVE
jgi:chaperonin GroES